MKKFKLYLEVPSSIGTITQMRMDKMTGFEDLIDFNQLVLHMAQQNLLIKEGKKYEIFKVELEENRFNRLMQEISKKQKHVLKGYVIISDGTFPLIQILTKQTQTAIK